MLTWLAVALGGALGAVGRYGVSLAVPTRPDGGFPWATLAVNLLGSTLLGAFAGLAVGGRLGPPAVQAALGAGFCGAFTTFSTFALDAVTLLRGGHFGVAATYLAVNVVGCLLLALVALELALGGSNVTR
jgi:CrcB protein